LTRNIKNMEYIVTPKAISSKATARREAILVEAAVLFRQRGYAATTMRDLAKAVGIEAASFYNHFKSKDDILKHICFETGGLFLHKAQAIAQQMEKGEKNSVQTLQSLLQMHVAITCEMTNEAFITDHEWKHLPEPLRKSFKTIRQNYEQVYLQVIKKGIANGELRNVEPTVALFTLLSSVRWLQYWYRPTRTLSPDDLQSTIHTLILNGLAI
jgi:TetR/AcrR family transcriptional regulator, cholesterol catabolism regulator